MIAGKASSEKRVSRSGKSPRSATHVERWTYCVSSESGRTRKRERVASPAAQPSAARAPGQASPRLGHVRARGARSSAGRRGPLPAAAVTKTSAQAAAQPVEAKANTAALAAAASA